MVLYNAHLEKGRFKMHVWVFNLGDSANLAHHMEIFVSEIFPNKQLKIALWLILNCIF